ncbi:hypothetical protein BHE74_00023359 [Ensete ventricosum]|nr:hypothetical protein GW17_00000273 [Ensete ventricosum]RWW69070.1 hypothetical protein BHE74_00023359 [Ensete ventricosum]RZR96221.1 hypothetical protein BHM03_00025203 [Ensete ventricosum]
MRPLPLPSIHPDPTTQVAEAKAGRGGALDLRPRIQRGGRCNCRACGSCLVMRTTAIGYGGPTIGWTPTLPRGPRRPIERPRGGGWPADLSSSPRRHASTAWHSWGPPWFSRAAHLTRNHQRSRTPDSKPQLRPRRVVGEVR